MIALFEAVFAAHPKEVDMTYTDHLRFAFPIGFSLLIAGLALMVHAVFPILFEHTGSSRVVDAKRRLTSPHDDDYEFWMI